MIDTRINEQNEDNTSSDELHHVDHEIWCAREATDMGFPIGGTVSEIYEDAVVLIPPLFRFEWNADRIKIGRILHIKKVGPDTVCEFVMKIEDGTQVPCMYGGAYPCFFALPENTKNFIK